jgi:hypothetical protein
MCGICGMAGSVDLATLGCTAEDIVHRGPDDKGFFNAGTVALGVRRLSIIDVAGGHQPAANEDATVVVAFNGEIYNHRELRTRLEGQGHQFRTKSGPGPSRRSLMRYIASLRPCRVLAGGEIEQSLSRLASNSEGVVDRT